MPVSFSQYRGTVYMSNNIFANKRCIRSRICLCRNIVYSVKNLFNFIGFLKKIALQNMLILKISKKFLICCFYLFLPYSNFYHIWLFPRLIYLSGDIEKSPGPEKDFSQTISIGHWNLNRFAAHNFVTLLKAYLSAQRFDIFCISKTYLKSSIAEDDDSLRIPGYGLIRSDYPSNNKEEVL